MDEPDPICRTCGGALPTGAQDVVCARCAFADVLSAPRRHEKAGAWRLIEPLGEGGMGVVWLAESDGPPRRAAAVKVLKPGLDSHDVIARFEAERQALALMEHPHIARMMDAGITEAGRPFFAMELAEGRPVTAFCREEKLTLHERLRLFLRVCDAVLHAHQRGVIHRDLKPSNILAARGPGGVPAPKIIDFGIARALGSRAITDTLLTQHGQVLGTPRYMSPEQAQGRAAGADTRADIFSLGVLLYEMITGALPYEAGDFDRTPAGPSRRPDAQPGISADLDWIVLRALEKEPERRYPTVSALADDIRRHLEHEPVLARPPSVFYRMQKLARRHRAVFAVSLIAVAALVAATIVSLRMSAAARAAEALALQRLAGAEAVPEFLIRALRSPAPDKRGRDVRVADVLPQAAAEAREKFAAQPVIRARLLEAVGRAYAGLGLFDEAEALLNEAQDDYENGGGALDTLRRARLAAQTRAVMQRFQGNRGKALRTNLALWQQHRDTLGAHHPDTLQARFEYTLNLLLSGDVAGGKVIVAEVTHDARTPEYFSRLFNEDLGALIDEQEGRLGELPAFYICRIQRALYQDRDAPGEYAASQMQHLVRVLDKLGRHAEADVLREELLLHAWRRLGPAHPWTQDAAADLRAVFQRQKRAVAEAHLEQWLAGNRETQEKEAPLSDDDDPGELACGPMPLLGVKCETARRLIDAGESAKALALLRPLFESGITTHPLAPEVAALIEKTPAPTDLRLRMAAASLRGGWAATSEMRVMYRDLVIPSLSQAEVAAQAAELEILLLDALVHDAGTPVERRHDFIEEIALAMQNRGAARAASTRLEQLLPQLRAGDARDDPPPLETTLLGLLARLEDDRNGPWHLRVIGHLRALLQNNPADDGEAARSRLILTSRALLSHVGDLDDAGSLDAMLRLARRLREMNLNAAAAPLLEKMLPAVRKSGQALLADTLGLLAATLQSQRLFRQALPPSEELTRLLTLTKGAEHIDTLTRRAQLAACLYMSGDLKRAAAELRDCIAAHTRARGAAHPAAMDARMQLIGLLLNSNGEKEALVLIHEQLALASARKETAPGHYFRTLCYDAYALKKAGLLKPAELRYREVLDTAPLPPKGHAEHAGVLDALRNATSGLRALMTDRGESFDPPARVLDFLKD